MKMKKTIAALIGAALSVQPLGVLALTQEMGPLIPEFEPMTSETKPHIVQEPYSAGSTVEQLDTQAMYRLYNPNSGEHFYTADGRERAFLTEAGWISEGIGWDAPLQSQWPVFRLYNGNAGDHHYTSDQEESQRLQELGWKYEGIGWYSADSGGLPVYRQYNPNAQAGAHNYTTDAHEDAALGEIGWQREGIGWYALQSSAPSANLMEELENRLAAMDMTLRTNNMKDLEFGDLREQGEQIRILMEMLTPYGNRYFAYRSGKLIGASGTGSSRVQVPGQLEGWILLVHPQQKKLERAERTENGSLSGLASAFGLGIDLTEYRAVAGSMTDGAFDGAAVSFDLTRDKDDLFEEMSSGMAKANVMDGVIRKHTHHFSGEDSNISDYRWTMQTADGTAGYTKEGDRYILFRDPYLEVFYLFEPVNLHFWSEKWSFYS